MTDAAWVSLFSGGKDSTFALYRARERGLGVRRLLTVHPPGDSYMYHVPATDVARLAAESVGIPHVDVEAGDAGSAGATDEATDDAADGDVTDADADRSASARGDREVAPLADALATLDDDLPGGIAGVVVGAVESEFQATRIEALADDLDIDVFAPLWHRDPPTLAREMLDAGFEIRIVAVAADGLDESWLGRRLDADALADLEALNETRGVHVLGEGGEFETLVTDGPHMDRPIELDYDTEWDGVRGSIVVRDAWLG